MLADTEISNNSEREETNFSSLSPSGFFNFSFNIFASTVKHPELQ